MGILKTRGDIIADISSLRGRLPTPSHVADHRRGDALGSVPGTGSLWELHDMTGNKASPDANKKNEGAAVLTVTPSYLY